MTSNLPTWQTVKTPALELLGVYSLNNLIWYASLKQGSTIISRRVKGFYANDADAWLAARKQFAGGKR